MQGEEVLLASRLKACFLCLKLFSRSECPWSACAHCSNMLSSTATYYSKMVGAGGCTPYVAAAMLGSSG